MPDIDYWQKEDENFWIRTQLLDLECAKLVNPSASGGAITR